MTGDQTQHRKYLLTINHPLDAGLNHEVIKDILASLNVDYWAMCDEIATTGTPHTHVYFVRQSKIRFRTIKSKFPTAHIDPAYGSSAECRDYLLKEGKYKGTSKSETTVAGTFEEFGMMPTDDKDADAKGNKEHLLRLIEEGKSNAQIIKEMPEFIFHEKDLDGIRQSILQQTYQHEMRPVEVTYLYGPDPDILTELVYDQCGIENLYRVPIVYKKQSIHWDSYQAQSVVLFEQFHSEIGYAEMIRYLQKYPLMLPARFRDRVACFTEVLVTSDVSPQKQYDYPKNQKPFLDYMDNVVKIDDDGCIEVQKGHWPLNRKDEVKEHDV